MKVTYTGIGQNPSGRSMVMLHHVQIQIFTKEDSVRAVEQSHQLMSTPRMSRERPPSLADDVVCATCSRRIAGKCFMHREPVADDYGCASYTARRRV